MGFNAVGQATIHNGAKTVRYFEKMLRQREPSRTRGFYDGGPC
jgi:hypothetical protein